MNAFQVREVNLRIADRWQKANSYPTLPVNPPSWAAIVVDAGDELLGVHAETAAPYPLDLHVDLSPEDRAIVIARRILAAGGTTAELIRFFDAFQLPQHARDRLARQVREATA
ncbi:MAG: hypothetical protein M3O98_03080 [Actinomycetota bacterium]|nr:hypothetical protein [Actinomycetota bacterium]